MERITSIPEDFLIELPLNSNQERILLDQINRFYDLKNKDISLPDISRTVDGNIILKEGTLIHGTHFNIDKIESIKKTGIVTGQAVGISEDGETYYCADFHRVSKDISIKNFNDQFTYVDGRCPFGKGVRGGKSLAFVIEPCEEARELLAYDCYRNETVESDITKSFTNSMLDNGENLSSILYGIPSNLIRGTILGNKLLEQHDIIRFMIKLFPNGYISTINGDILYDPKVDQDFSELVSLRTYKYMLEWSKNRLNTDIARFGRDLYGEKRRYESLLNEMMNDLPSNDVAKFLVDEHFVSGNVEDAIDYINTVKNGNLNDKSSTTK